MKRKYILIGILILIIAGGLGIYWYWYSVPPLAITGCSINDTIVSPGEEVNWKVEYKGGRGPYKVKWVGDDDIKKEKRSFSHVYDENGTYEIKVTVKDNRGKKVSKDYEIGVSDLKVNNCKGNPSRAATGEKVLWKASFGSGMKPYKITWEGDDSLAGKNSQVSKVYDNKGIKKSKVCVTDTVGKKECANCKVRVKNHTSVFLSSVSHNGNFGTLEKADEFCQQLAKEAAVPNHDLYKAWLSSAYIPVKDRFFHSPLPYKLLNDKTVADDWEDLTDGDINHRINLDERRESHTAVSVWTGTDAQGNEKISHSYNCKNWTSEKCLSRNQAYLGRIGYTYLKDENWTEQKHMKCCKKARLYCFEQLREPGTQAKTKKTDQPITVYRPNGEEEFSISAEENESVEIRWVTSNVDKPLKYYVLVYLQKGSRTLGRLNSSGIQCREEGYNWEFPQVFQRC